MRWLLALLLSCQLAAAQDITDYYWVVGDTSPTTQVYKSSTGTFVSNTDATYENWLLAASSGFVPGRVGFATSVCGVNNNAGQAQLQLCTPIAAGWNGQTKSVFGVTGVPGINAAWPIQLDDPVAGLVTLVGSTFSGAWTGGGTVGSAPFLATAAQAYAVVDQFNRNVYATGQIPYALVNVTAALTLTVPVIPVYLVNMSAAGQNIQLPAANLPRSLPIGLPVLFMTAAGSQTWTLKDSAGVTLKTQAAGQSIVVMLGSNANAEGTYVWSIGTN